MQRAIKASIKIVLYTVLAGLAAMLSVVFGGSRGYHLAEYGVSTDNEKMNGTDVAHADVPYSEASYYAEASYGGGGEGSEGSEGSGEGGEGGR